MKNGITAVIPVRAGSSRIVNKNIRPFAGSSLLKIKIEQLKRIDKIDNIVVSSDSPEMLKIAEANGVIAKKRPIEYCDEKTRTFNEVVEYIASEEVETEHMIWCPCVCPLIKDDSLIDALNIYKKILKEEIHADSIASALLLKEYVFGENGPVNFSVEHHVPSQMLPKWHTIQNGFFIAPTKSMQTWKFVYGPDPYLYEISKLEAIDIDEMIEFEMAEYLFRKINE